MSTNKRDGGGMAANGSGGRDKYHQPNPALAGVALPRRGRGGVECTCEYCGAPFLAGRWWARFCCSRCRVYAWEERQRDEAKEP